MTLSFPSAARQAAALAAGSVSSRELTAHYLGAIAAANPSLHAYLDVFESAALAAADAADARRRAGSPRSAVDGVPVAIKDNICSTLGRTTCASKILENFRPPYDATTVTRLLDAGCVPLGKTNMDEFAMGSSCENSAFGPTRNPWDPTRVPGGSSGGSAAAVAGGLAPWALGSDTGGSIRQPASFCGIVGLKPTYGRVSRYGLVAFASSLDQIGPMTLDVADTALLLEVIAGHDPMDSTSSPSAPDAYSKDLLPGSLKGLRIGRPAEYFPSDGVDADVRAAMDGALRAFEDLGAEIVDVRLPHTEYAISCYYLVATAEASSNLARYDGAHYGYRAPGTTNIIDMFSRTRAQGFGAEVKRRIMIGTYALSAGYFDAYYMKALKVRTLIKQDFDEALSKVDVLVGPTTPSPAFGIGAKASDPLAMYLCDIFTIALNLAGTCGLSMPAGYSQGGLPIGLQLIGRPFGEKRLLQVAAALEAKLALPARVPSAAAAPMALG